MAKSNRGGKIGAGGKTADTINDLKKQIDDLKANNAALMQSDYTGRKGWSSQLESQVKKAANNNRQIEKLESQIKKLERGETKPQKAEKKAAPSWKRAGEGWYIGANGHEIRENYDTGGYDIVKISGRAEKTIKHFTKLSEAKKYSIK